MDPLSGKTTILHINATRSQFTTYYRNIFSAIFAWFLLWFVRIKSAVIFYCLEKPKSNKLCCDSQINQSKSNLILFSTESPHNSKSEILTLENVKNSAKIKMGSKFYVLHVVNPILMFKYLKCNCHYWDSQCHHRFYRFLLISEHSHHNYWSPLKL